MAENDEDIMSEEPLEGVEFEEFEVEYLDSAEGPHFAAETGAEYMEVDLAVLGSVYAEDFSATGCAIGYAPIDGDATITASAVPLVKVGGDAVFKQAYASAFVAGGSVDMKQAATPFVLARAVELDQSASCVMLAGETAVERSAVGVLISGRATISDDSRVLITTKAAIIIALAVLGGFGLVALVMVLGAKEVASKRPRFHIPEQFRGVAETVRGFDSHAASSWIEERAKQFRAMAEARRAGH